MSEPTIAVTGVGFAYPDGTVALRDVDLHIHPGERVALLGPNGAGKTSLVLHLNGITLPQTGSVQVSGIPVTAETVGEIRRRVGLVFQDPDDQLFMPTVRRDVAFGPLNLGLDHEAVAGRVAAALAAVEITELADRPPNHLSLGQRRRAAIAGVLAMEPEIMVLDEPTSNLDPATRRELAALLLRLHVTLLVVTHDLPFALEVCERAVIIDHGAIVADGPTRRLLADGVLMAAHRLELPYGMALSGE
ncbi:MAG: cobalt ABC transporter ATP-binding protein [Actinobacteria bacterium RBG_16_68_21]|nr:MAG: cobalt ABC transporter ATP-binding protein [Actinobacteria bacterium RBG_16_68_21]